MYVIFLVSCLEYMKRNIELFEIFIIAFNHYIIFLIKCLLFMIFAFCRLYNEFAVHKTSLVFVTTVTRAYGTNLILEEFSIMNQILAEFYTQNMFL